MVILWQYYAEFWLTEFSKRQIENVKIIVNQIYR